MTTASVCALLECSVPNACTCTEQNDTKREASYLFANVSSVVIFEESWYMNTTLKALDDDRIDATCVSLSA